MAPMTSHASLNVEPYSQSKVMDSRGTRGCFPVLLSLILLIHLSTPLPYTFPPTYSSCRAVCSTWKSQYLLPPVCSTDTFLGRHTINELPCLFVLELNPFVLAHLSVSLPCLTLHFWLPKPPHAFVPRHTLSVLPFGVCTPMTSSYGRVDRSYRFL